MIRTRPPACLAHRAFEDVTDAQLAPDLLHIERVPVIRIARDRLLHKAERLRDLPVDVAARPAEAGDRAGPDRIADAYEDDRDRLSYIFCRACRRDAATCRDHVDLAADEIGG